MQNKGFVKVFAVLLTLVCVFYLVHGAFGAGSFHIGDIGTGADGGIRDGIGKGEGVVILTVTRLYHLYHVSACAGGEEEGCYD